MIQIPIPMDDFSVGRSLVFVTRHERVRRRLLSVFAKLGIEASEEKLCVTVPWAQGETLSIARDLATTSVLRLDSYFEASDAIMFAELRRGPTHIHTQRGCWCSCANAVEMALRHESEVAAARAEADELRRLRCLSKILFPERRPEDKPLRRDLIISEAERELRVAKSANRRRRILRLLTKTNDSKVA